MTILQASPGESAAVGGGVVSASLATAVAWPGTPTHNWRLPITAAYLSADPPVTSSAQTATQQAALAAASTNKNFPWFSVQSPNAYSSAGYRDCSLQIGPVGPAGAVVVYIPDFCYDWSVACQQSFDSVTGAAGDGTWSALPHTPWAPTDSPQDSAHFNRRSQLVMVPPGASRWVRLTFTNNGTDGAGTSSLTMLSVNVGAFDLNGATDFRLVAGMSITLLDSVPLVLRSYLQTIDAAADPVYLNAGASGHTVANITDYALTPVLQSVLPAGVRPNCIFLDPGPNDAIHHGIWAVNPFVVSAAGGPLWSAYAWDFRRMIWTARQAGCPVFCANIGYSDYDAAVAGGYAVNDLANPEHGNKPYNDNIIVPIMRQAQLAVGVDPSIDAPWLDEYSAFMAKPPQKTFYMPDGVHLVENAHNLAQAMWQPAQYWTQTGTLPAGGNALGQKLLAAAGGAPAYHIARLQACLAQLPPTADATATANRIALATALASFPTTYSDPIGPMPGGPLAHWDFANWATMQNYAGGTGDLVGDQVGQVADRIGGYLAVKTDKLDYYVNSFYFDSRPVFLPCTLNGHGMLRAVDNERLICTSPAFGALNGAGQPFMLFLAVRFDLFMVTPAVYFALADSSGNTCFKISGEREATFGRAINQHPEGWQSLSLLQLRSDSSYGSGVAPVLLTEPGSVPLFSPWVPYILGILYDGSTLSIRRNGTQTAAAAWAKPAWTAGQMVVFGAPTTGGATPVGSLDIGEVVLCADYSLADAAAIESALRAKWGA